MGNFKKGKRLKETASGYKTSLNHLRQTLGRLYAEKKS